MEQGAAGNSFLVILIIFVGVMLFVSSRGQKKREQQRQTIIKSLQKGDKVILIGGVIGTIVGFKDNLFEVKISENTKITVLENGIVDVFKDNVNANGVTKK
jgi:preprotein translocase, YajC subunit